MVRDIACPAISIHIQSDSLAGTNVSSGCSNLDVSTESVNGEVGSNSLTSSNGSGYRVNASRNVDALGSSTRAPRVGNSRQVGGQHTSRDHGVVAFANHIVAMNLNQGRSRIHRNGSGGRSQVGNTTLSVHHSSVDGVGTRVEEVQRNGGQVLTRNFDTVEIPDIMIASNRGIDLDRGLVVLTNRESRSLENRSGRFRVNKHRNLSHNLTSVVAIEGSRHMIGSCSGRADGDGLGGGIGSIIPHIGNGTCPTIGIGMQHCGLTFADRLLNSIQGDVGTELGNGERIGHHSTMRNGIGNGHGVGASRNVCSLVGTSGGRPSESIVARGRSRRQHTGGEVSVSAIANSILTYDNYRRSSQRIDRGGNFLGAAHVGGHSFDRVRTGTFHIEGIGKTGSFRNQSAVHIPCIGSIIISGIWICHCEGNQRAETNRGGCRVDGNVCQSLGRILNSEVCRLHIASEVLIQGSNRIVACCKEVGVDIGSIIGTTIVPNPHVRLLIARSVGVGSH